MANRRNAEACEGGPRRSAARRVPLPRCAKASHGWLTHLEVRAVGRAILLESALSFFGVGVQPPTASWGNMLYQAQTTMSSEPWLGIFPGADAGRGGA